MTEYIIEDFGPSESYPCSGDNKVIFTIYQYGVWVVEGEDLIEVVEASNDLDYLINKYNAEVVKREE